MSTLKSKRFVVRKSLIGKNQIIEVTFKSGKQVTYNHDTVYEIMKDKLETMNCFIKYKSYTSSTSIPVILRDKELVQSLSILQSKYDRNKIIYMNLNNNNMTELQRTDLLNYLNNNKIDYNFELETETITINLK